MYKRIWKRMLDIILSLILIIILSPLMLIIIILIKIDDLNSPIIFKQKRIGSYNKEFVIFKFRTMKKNAPNVAKSEFKNNMNEYITRIGKFLRNWSLDELPQLFNVFKGEMSIVGPRPALYNQYDLINLRTKLGIHTLKPGITGWAQINGRENIDIKTKVELDKYYFDNLSFCLDCIIIFKTIKVVLTKEGNY